MIMTVCRYRYIHTTALYWRLMFQWMPLNTLVATDMFVSEVLLYCRFLTKPSQHVSLYTQQEIKAIFDVFMVVTKNDVIFDLKIRLQEKYFRRFGKTNCLGLQGRRYSAFLYNIGIYQTMWIHRWWLYP